MLRSRTIANERKASRLNGSVTGAQLFERGRDGPRFAQRQVLVERRGDGTILLRSPVPLGDVAPHVPAYLRRWAGSGRIRHGLRSALDRTARGVTCAMAMRSALWILTQSLLDLGGPEKGPLLILSANSIEHALITLAGMQARIPVAPVSPAYSLVSRDHAKLKHVFAQVNPGFIFVQDAPPFAAAMAALPIEGRILLHVDRPPQGHHSHAFADLAARAVTPAVADPLPRSRRISRPASFSRPAPPQCRRARPIPTP